MSSVMLIDDYYDDSDFENDSLDDDIPLCYRCYVCDGNCKNNITTGVYDVSY